MIYTLKVLDIILGLTQGGPANATQTIATQSYQRSFVEFKFGEGAALSNILIVHLAGVRHRLPAVHPPPDRRVRSRPCPKSPSRGYLRTALAIVLLVIMLFPLYWMVNASFQASGNTLNATLIPTNPSLAGYEVAIRDQGRNLVTSLLIASGTVVLTLLIATPAAYALAQFRFRWVGIGPAADPDHPDDPRHRDRQRSLLHVREPRSAQLDPRADPRQLDARPSRSRS